MKNLFLILFLFISILFLFISKNALPQDSIPQLLVEYEKLNPEKVKEIYKMESSKHRIGRITFYSYSPSEKLYKETGYENEDGKLAFMFEYGYKYDDKDSLVYAYKYTEIPSSEYPELEETRYFYPSDSLTIITTTIGENQTDSTFICITKDISGKIVQKSETAKRSYKGRTRLDKMDITQYYYNDKGQLINILITNKMDGNISRYDYKYDKDKIQKYSYSRKDYQSVTTFNNGLRNAEEETYASSARKYYYTYNKNGQEIVSKLYEDGKHIYSYVSSYNKKGLKIKYDMINESDGSSGIWIYEYDKSGELIYKIDLYAREK